jgi:transposase
MTNSTKTLNKIGVDVAKRKLDVALDETRFVTMDNHEKAYIAFLKTLKAPLDSLHFVMEATGGYEKKFAAFLLSKSIAVSIVNPKRVRDYAKAMGKLAKNDRIDATVIREYANTAKLVVIEQQSPSGQQLKALVKRRNQLSKHHALEKQYLETTTDKASLRSINGLIKVLERQIQSLHTQIQSLMDQDPDYCEKKQMIIEVDGIGEQTAANLLANLPEMGTLTNKQIAALAGVAPFCNDSGNHKGKRMIWGGRKEVRTALYMPMLSAIRFNKPIQAYYQRLVKRGKVRQVAVIACMRKLLTILNSMLRNNTRWNPDYANSH